MKWLNDLKISTKLTAAFVFLAAIVGLVGQTGRAATSDLSARVQEMKGNALESVLILTTLQQEMALYRGDAWRIVANPKGVNRDTSIREANARPPVMEELIKKYEATICYPGEAEQLAIVKTGLHEITATRERVFAMPVGEEAEAGRILGAASPHERTARAAVARLVEINSTQADKLSVAAI